MGIFKSRFLKEMFLLHIFQGLANLQRSLTDLFGAGSETSSSVLLFAFLYMIKYPDVQVNKMILDKLKRSDFSL